jgi:hypothetical protein
LIIKVAVSIPMVMPRSGTSLPIQSDIQFET